MKSKENVPSPSPVPQQQQQSLLPCATSSTKAATATSPASPTAADGKRPRRAAAVVAATRLSSSAVTGDGIGAVRKKTKKNTTKQSVEPEFLMEPSLLPATVSDVVRNGTDASVPPRNSSTVNDGIASRFCNPSYCLENYNQFCHHNPMGDPRAHLLDYHKYVIYRIEQFSNEYTSQEFSVLQIMVYMYYELSDAADHIEATAEFKALANNHGVNDMQRRAASACIKGFPRVLHILQNFISLLKGDCGLYSDVFPTSGDGTEDSITLLVSLVGCLRQKEHYDYNHVLFGPVERYEGQPEELKGSYLLYQGCSLFINFDWLKEQTLDLDFYNNSTGDFQQIHIPPMSILIIKGNLKHAGSPNKSMCKVRKFFLYLDPCKGCRMLGKFGESGDDNYIHFDAHHRRLAEEESKA